MKDFILDEEIKNVKSTKVQKYLKEIVSSYYSNNYRATIVLLYSIVIFDFIEKLQTLSEVYENESATKFLKEFEEKQKKPNAKYSDLENEIIKEIEKQKILNAIEISQLEQLRNTRHYCAHPVFKNNFELINPNKEQTIAHIRNMFEAVFLKDAILNNKIFEEFLSKLEDFYLRSEIEGLEKYLNARYFSKLNEDTKKYIFKNLWKLSFYSKDNEDCEKNRRPLCYALIYLMKKDIKMFEEYFKDNKEYFNSKILCEKIEIEIDDKDFTFFDYPILASIYFLSQNPKLYNYINADNKVEIENICKKNINIFLLSSFISNNIEKHIEDVKSMISGHAYCIDSDVFFKVYEYSKDINPIPLRKLAIHYFFYNVYSKRYGRDFDYINWIYRDILSKILDDFNAEDIDELLKGMDSTYKDAHCYSELKNQIVDLVNNGIEILFENYEISQKW